MRGEEGRSWTEPNSRTFVSPLEAAACMYKEIEVDGKGQGVIWKWHWWRREGGRRTQDPLPAISTELLGPQHHAALPVKCFLDAVSLILLSRFLQEKNAEHPKYSLSMVSSRGGAWTPNPNPLGVGGGYIFSYTNSLKSPWKF